MTNDESAILMAGTVILTGWIGVLEYGMVSAIVGIVLAIGLIYVYLKERSRQ